MAWVDSVSALNPGSAHHARMCLRPRQVEEDWNSTPRSAGRGKKRQVRTSVKSSLRAVLKAVTKFKCVHRRCCCLLQPRAAPTTQAILTARPIHAYHARRRLLLRRRARQAAEAKAAADAAPVKKRRRRRRRRGQRVSASSALSGDGTSAVIDHVLGLPGDVDSGASSYETESDADDDMCVLLGSS